MIFLFFFLLFLTTFPHLSCSSPLLILNYTLRNPTSSIYNKELVRLPVTIPISNFEDLCIRDTTNTNTIPILHQVDLLSETIWVYIDTLAPGSFINYTLISPKGNDCTPKPLPRNASAVFYNNSLILSNGLIDIILPQSTNVNEKISSPIAPFLGFAMTSGKNLIGSSIFDLSSELQSQWTGNLSVSILSLGPLFVEALALYTFSKNGTATWKVRVTIEQLGAQITEEYINLDVESGIDLILHSGEDWSPSIAVSNGWAYCDPNDPTNPDGMNATTSQQKLPLGPLNRLPNGSLGVIVARWSQSCDAKFFWGVENNTNVLGVMGIKSGEWLWPQYTSLTYDTQRRHLMNPWSTKQGEGYIHLPLHGRRVWYLLGGLTNDVSDNIWNLAQQYAMMELDRLTNVYDLLWPEANEPINTTYNASGYHFYSPNTDPTHSVRAQGVSLLKSLNNISTSPRAGLESAAAANTYCDKDWWGSYIGFSSPENPNFFTDWSKLCLGWSLALVVRNHPRSIAYCALARGIWELDLYHSITLPSGAGQESPGYTAHALASWLVEAPLLDLICPNATNPAQSHPRLVAAIYFLLRTSQPWAYHFLGPAAVNNSNILSGRFVLPLGDTHPTSTNFSQLVNLLQPVTLPLTPVEEWTSSEFVGFGVVLQSRTGTSNETFFAFKASPNRGHNHGDQLSFHYAAYGSRIVIDVMAGYLPRPPQEFWHNRLCFGNLTNIDGTERLVGFKNNIQVESQLQSSKNTTLASIAVGQVTSYRLQNMPAIPPPNFLQVFPTTSLPSPIVYRRSTLFLPAPTFEVNSRDCIILLDAHNASNINISAYSVLLFFQQFGMIATELKNISSNCIGLDMGNSTVITFAINDSGQAIPLTYMLDRWNWTSEGNENATRLKVFSKLNETTSTTIDTSLFITILYPQGSVSIPSTSQVSIPMFDFINNTLKIIWPLGTVDVITFTGALVNASLILDTIDDKKKNENISIPIVTLIRNNSASIILMNDTDLSYSRFQGDIGLNILDTGYTFNEIPNQVIEERGGNLIPPSYPFPIPH